MSDSPKWDELPDFIEMIDEDWDFIDESDWVNVPEPIVDKEYEDMFV